MTPLTRLVSYVDVERDEARRLAQRELADPVYEDDPPLPQRIMEWLLRQLDKLSGEAVSLFGGWGSLALLIPIAIIVAIVLWRFGPMARRAARRQEPLFGERKRSADEYRRAADEEFRQENWTASALERFRAIIAGLEERDILPGKAGRTADEAARDAGRLLPGLADRLAAGAAIFDDMRYGERAATRDEAVSMRELDRDVRTARISDEPAVAASGPAVPR